VREESRESKVMEKKEESYEKEETTNIHKCLSGVM
jgi:hypothetical protein